MSNKAMLHSFQFHGNPEIDKFQTSDVMEKHGKAMKSIQEATTLCDTSFFAITMSCLFFLCHRPPQFSFTGVSTQSLH